MYLVDVILDGTKLSNMSPSVDFINDHIESTELDVSKRFLNLTWKSLAAFLRLLIFAFFQRYIFRFTGLHRLAFLSDSTDTMSWSPIPGIVVHLLTNDGLFVRKTSRILK